MSQARIYLDSAATSWPKPESVYQAVDHYQRHIGAAAGRGAYRHADQSAQIVRQTRQAVAQMIGASDPTRVVFTLNATDALNLALHGLLLAGDHVVTTVAEHNSVLRPLRELARIGVQTTHVVCDGQGLISPDDVRRALRPATRLIALVHVSNVTGAIQPLEDVARLAAEHDIVLLVDAAQSAGHLPLDVSLSKIDLLATSGHKGLLGPLGTGILYIRAGLESALNSLRQGGTGTQSEHDRQPDELPEKYEAGNLNVVGLAGLGAGIRHLQETGLEQVRRHEQSLTRQLIEGLRTIAGVHVYGPSDVGGRLGVVSLTIKGYDPQEVAAMLDAAHGIQTRAGLHCAPRMHESLGTKQGGGTLRLSIGHFTTADEVRQALAAVEEIAAAAPVT